MTNPTIEDNTLASIGDEDEGECGGSDLQLKAGTYAGRYMILEQIGRGGMGVVYKAYDPELDRKIALKLLRVTGKSASRADRARDRLLREAKALAQLSHPNVVSAVDVGTLGDDVFVAMELVEGQTLMQWIKDEKPNQRKVVQVLIQAGRGLQAAHQAGLIHRDVKPDNIIVGADGRVRVLDFGLARAASIDEMIAEAEQRQRETAALATPNPDPTGVTLSGDSQSGTASLRTRMTLAGAVLGTPGYMAPEQYLGQDLDEQADQYSFCVSLYEALYTYRPFEATSYRELKSKVTTEPVGPPPPNSKVPAYLRRILLRGLATKKEDRYPSLTELLFDLGKDPWRVWRRVILAAVVALLVVASFVTAAAYQASKQRLCQAAAERLAGVWDEPTQQAVERAFLATDRSYAGDTFARADKVLSQYAQAWVTMRTEACEATHLRGEQSERLLDKRMHCLDRRLGQFGALTRLFAAQADGALVDKAVAAASALPKLALCADSEALMATSPLPNDPALRGQIEKVRQNLDRAQAFLRAGKYPEGKQLAKQIAQQALALDFPPLQAETEYLLGFLLKEMGDAKAGELRLKQALHLAAVAKDDRLMAKTLAELVQVLGDEQARYGEAIEIGVLAEAIVIRAGEDPVLEARTLARTGIVRARMGELAAARKDFVRAIGLEEKALGPEHLHVASGKVNLGAILFMQGHFAQARKQHQAALAIMESALGPNHPDLAKPHINLGNALNSMGEFDAAGKHYRRALELWEAALGPDHVKVAFTVNNLGDVLEKQGKLAEALQHYQRAEKILEKVYGQQHPALAQVIDNIANIHAQQGKTTEARALYRRALAIREKALGPDNYEVGDSYYKLGSTLAREGKIEQALVLLGRALGIWEKALGPDHPKLAHALIDIAACRQDQQAPLVALPLLERALKIRKDKQVDQLLQAEAQFALARGLWAAHRDRDRARELARKAHAIFAKAGQSQQLRLGEVDAWLAKHGQKASR